MLDFAKEAVRHIMTNNPDQVKAAAISIIRDALMPHMQALDVDREGTPFNDPDVADDAAVAVHDRLAEEGWSIVPTMTLRF